MTTIEADGVELEVVDGMSGAAVTSTAPEADGLTFILNNAARGLIRDLKERLLRGEETSAGSLFVERPHPLDDNDIARDRWKRLSGNDPGDDVYVVGVAELGNIIMVPRLTLLSLYEQLMAIRRDWVPPPPEPPRAPPPPTPEPTPEPFSVPEAELADLENRARDLDALDAAARTEDDRATVAARRRILLNDLAHAGIFDEDRGDDKARLLSDLGLMTLAAYRDAAGKLRAYVTSDERLRCLPPVDLKRLHSAPVSLDWFRKGVPTPEGYDPDKWLVELEFGLKMMARHLKGGEGDLYTGGGGRTARLFWRKDDGVTPALLKAQVRP